MKIRLCGSYLVPRSTKERCSSIELGLLLAQLPSHCFAQTQLPFESLDTVVLIYTYDDSFDFEYWMNNCFEE